MNLICSIWRWWLSGKGEVQGGGWAVSHFIFIAFEADPRLEPIPPTSDRWSTNLVWKKPTRGEASCTQVTFKAVRSWATKLAWRPQNFCFVTFIWTSSRFVLFCGQLDFIVVWSYVHISTNISSSSQILLLPGQPWPTLLLGHMGWHIHFSFFKIKNIFESRNWWPFKAGQLGVIHSFVWYYRGRGGLKLRLIRTSFTLGPSETQFRLNCLAFSLSNLLQHLDSDQVGIYASRNI